MRQAHRLTSEQYVARADALDDLIEFANCRLQDGAQAEQADGLRWAAHLLHYHAQGARTMAKFRARDEAARAKR